MRALRYTTRREGVGFWVAVALAAALQVAWYAFLIWAIWSLVRVAVKFVGGL